jgi:type IV secretion system protein VirB4
MPPSWTSASTPTRCSRGILNALLYEASEFIETQSFSILPRREAMGALELQRDQLIASDDVVASQVAEMDVALNELGDGQFCMGEYHYSLVVFGDDVADAGRRAAQAIGAVGRGVEPADVAGRSGGRRGLVRADAGQLAMAAARREAVVAGLRGAGQRPQLRARQARRQSLGRSAGADAHAIRPAVLPEPAQSVPEGEDSADKKLPGNTLIIGSTGVGKTTLEMFLLTLTRKWDPAPRLVLFDLDRGCEIAIRALGGRYFALEAGKPTGCNPAAARADAGARAVLGATRSHLHRDPGAAADAFGRARHCRCGQGGGDDAPGSTPVLDSAAEPAEGGREQPLRAARPVVPGRRAWLGLRHGRRPARRAAVRTSVIGFDTTEFLDLPEVRTPVMMYLLQVMEELVNGERLIYVISEFWKALDHPIFSDFAKQKQKTIRKQNGLGIFDTQSPSDVLRHPIGRTMIEQSVTKIFLANPRRCARSTSRASASARPSTTSCAASEHRAAGASWSSRATPARSANSTSPGSTTSSPCCRRPPTTWPCSTASVNDTVTIRFNGFPCCGREVQDRRSRTSRRAA